MWLGRSRDPSGNGRNGYRWDHGAGTLVRPCQLTRAHPLVGSIKDVIAKTSVAWKEWRAVIKTDILGFPAREASTLNSLVQHEPGNTTA